MAQWIRRPPTERKIPGSIPGVEDQSFWRPLALSAENSFYLQRTRNVRGAAPGAANDEAKLQ